MYGNPLNDFLTSFILVPNLYGPHLENLWCLWWDAYDVIYTKGINVDEWDLLFSGINVYILKIVSDL